LNIEIHSRDIKVSPEEKEYALDHIELLSHHYDKILHIHLEVQIPKHLPLEIQVPGPKSFSVLKNLTLLVHVNGKMLKSQTSAWDFRIGVDQLVEKMDGQLIKQKEKTKNHKFKEHPLRKLV
jgi:ribosomal subunit interface protein